MCDVPIVIATKNEQNYLDKTLGCLSISMDEAERSGIITELIIVDSSDDSTHCIARKFTEKVDCLPSEGVSKARNYGTVVRLILVLKLKISAVLCYLPIIDMPSMLYRSHMPTLV